AVALDPDAAPRALPELADRYARAGVRRWAIWVDGAARDVTTELRRAGLMVASASPGMGAEIGALPLNLPLAQPDPTADPRPVTLQASEQGERLYVQLGLHRLGNMELWEHRR